MASWFPSLGLLIEQGGSIVLALLMMFLLATTIAIAKIVQFAWLGINANEPVYKALKEWRRGHERQAVDILKAIDRRPVARVVDAAMHGLLSDRSEETVREEVMRIARNHVARLRGWLRVLEIIAQLSPLMGLLGTVIGMIEAFKNLEEAGNQVDPTILSGGIWQALLTTAVGLLVAIPVMVTHHWLERRVEQCAHSMEDCATRVFTTVSETVQQRLKTEVVDDHTLIETTDSASASL